MTTKELEKYQRTMAGMEGACSPIPPRWAERSRLGTGEAIPASPFVPLDVEINVVSIVMPDVQCGWEPVKAEPFVKRLVAPLFLTQGAWWTRTQSVQVLNGELNLPHVSSHTCWHGRDVTLSVWEPEDLKPLIAQMSMIASEINLSSLLAWPHFWDERLFRFIPKKLMGYSFRRLTREDAHILARLRETADYKGQEYVNRIWSEP